MKNGADLGLLVKNVIKAWEAAEKAQHARWRSFLYQRRYPKKFVDEYLRLGLLPRLIKRTYDNFLRLLTTARELLQSTDGSTIAWKESRGEALIKYHGGKLKDLRSFSPNYRTFILSVYVYLRDAATKTEFRHPSMMDPIWDEIANLKAKLDTRVLEEPPPSGNTESRCGWCHRKGLHQEGKGHCPGKDITAAQARKLLKGVPKSLGPAVIKEGCTLLAAKIAEEPNGDIDTMINSIRKDNYKMNG